MSSRGDDFISSRLATYGHGNEVTQEGWVDPVITAYINVKLDTRGRSNEYLRYFACTILRYAKSGVEARIGGVGIYADLNCQDALNALISAGNPHHDTETVSWRRMVTCGTGQPCR